MRRFAAPLAVTALLAAGGFAAVAIAQGGGLAGLTTASTTGTTSTTPSRPPAKVTICHRTGSKTHPFVTITVAAPAVRAHLAHGDQLGRCTLATINKIKSRSHGHGHGTSTTTTTTTSTTQTTSTTKAPGNSGNHGNSGDHGNSGNHGNGGGAGKGHH
jgi:hypothetical protein